MSVGLTARPRAVALVVAAFAVAITGAVAVVAAPWTPVAAGGALLAAGFVVMAPCELQMATVLATVVGRAGDPGVPGTALRFTAGYLAYCVPFAVAIGALAHLAGGAAWVLGAVGGVLALLLGLAALGDAGPAWLRRCRGPLYLLRSGRASFRRPLRAGVAFGQYCSTCCGPYAFALAVFAGGGPARLARGRDRRRLRGADGAPVPRAGPARAAALGVAQPVPRNRPAGARSLRRPFAGRAWCARRTGVPGCGGERRMVIDLATLVPVALYGFLYAQLVLHRRRASGRIDWRRTCAYTLGLVAIVIALDSKLDALADEGSITAHMVQHELLGNIAPFLLLLGLDAALARPVTQKVFGPVIRRPPWRRALRAANSPVLAVALYVGAMWLWYVPAVYAHVSASPVLHPLGHVLFIATGLLFWFHVLRPLPALVTLTPRQKLAYLLAGTLGGSVVAAVLVKSEQRFYLATNAQARGFSQGHRRRRGRRCQRGLR